jgi:hypothetical protein
MVLGLFVLGANTASTAQYTGPTTKTLQVASPQHRNDINDTAVMDNVTPNTLRSSTAAAVASNRRICLELMRLFDRVCACTYRNPKQLSIACESVDNHGDGEFAVDAGSAP